MFPPDLVSVTQPRRVPGTHRCGYTGADVVGGPWASGSESHRGAPPCDTTPDSLRMETKPWQHLTVFTFKCQFKCHPQRAFPDLSSSEAPRTQGLFPCSIFISHTAPSERMYSCVYQCVTALPNDIQTERAASASSPCPLSVQDSV